MTKSVLVFAQPGPQADALAPHALAVTEHAAAAGISVPTARLLNISSVHCSSSLGRADEIDDGIGCIHQLVVALQIVFGHAEPCGDGRFQLVDSRQMRDGAPSRVLGQLLARFFGTELRQGRGLVLRQAALLILVAAAARAGIIASGLGHYGQHLRAEEDASLVPRPVDRRYIPPAAARL